MSYAMLCADPSRAAPRASTSSAAAAALMAGGPRCPGMVRRAAAPLEFMEAWLPKCSVTFAGLGERLVDNPARSVRTKEHAVSDSGTL